jgi:ATP adenylyltransferase
MDSGSDSNKTKWLILGGIGAIAAGVALYGLYKMKQPTTKGSIFSRRIQELRQKIISVVDNSESIEYFTRNDTVTITDPKIKGLSLLIIHAENLSKKSAPKFKKDNPFIPPFEKGLFVVDLENHRVLVNKFAIIKYHVLVTTKLMEDQHSLMSEQDFTSSYVVLKALRGFCFYNGGTESGSSQPHRHVQVCPITNEMPLDIYNQIEAEMAAVKPEATLGYKVHNVSVFSKYRHYVVSLPIYDPDTSELSAEEFSKVYYQRYMKLLEMLDNKELRYSYNLLWTERWMLMVLRSKEYLFDKYSVNSLGILGSFLVKSTQDKDELAKRTPSEIYDDIYVML